MDPTAGPHRLPRALCACVVFSACRLMDLSAARDVERMRVSRDQDCVSAMQTIVTGSVLVKRVTRLLLWTLFGPNVAVFGLFSVRAGECLTWYWPCGDSRDTPIFSSICSLTIKMATLQLTGIL